MVSRPSNLWLNASGAPVIVLPSTVIATYRIRDVESRAGSRLHLEISHAEGKVFRAAAYGRPQLIEKERNSIIGWNQFPHQINETVQRLPQ